MLYLNNDKNQRSFTRKGVTYKKNQTSKKLFSFFLFKIFVVTLFITLNLISSHNFISEDESSFYLNNQIENNKNPIKTFNDNLINKEDYINNHNNQENSWFSSNNIFWYSFIIFICGCCAYFFYKNGFSFGNDNNIKNEVPVQNIAAAILKNVPLDLIADFKANILYYFKADPLTSFEIIFRIDNFLEYPDSAIGEHAILKLEQILYNINMNKHLFVGIGDLDKGAEILTEIISEIKKAIIIGHKA